MTISVILAHPRPRSLNHAIAEVTREQLEANGRRVFFHDLCEEQFDPILPFAEIARDAVLPPLIETHCREIAAAEGVVIIHPNWWGMPPAILTGWVDRVIRPGVAYEFLEGDGGEGVPRGLLKAKAVLVFNTSNTEPGRERSVFGDPLETLWKNCVFGLCGVPVFHRRMFNIVVVSTAEQRRGWLAEVNGLVDEFFPTLQ
ncbi:MAG: NAD(P)H-dependent oxidoreductase [Pseudomonadota bacterium]